MTKALSVIVAFVVAAGAAVADEALIAGTGQAVDASANTLRFRQRRRVRCGT